MASKGCPVSRTDLQEQIKKQGEIIRNLKLEEQTDEVKNKVPFDVYEPQTRLTGTFCIICRKFVMPTCKNN